MNEPKQYLVSNSGQMSLPAAVRKRWHLEKGGPVLVRDLGWSVTIMPVGGAAQTLEKVLSAEDHLKFVQEIDDPDLRTT